MTCKRQSVGIGPWVQEAAGEGRGPRPLGKAEAGGRLFLTLTSPVPALHRDLPHPFYACSCIWVFFQTTTFVTFEISLLLGGESTLGTTAVMSPKARPQQEGN